MTTHTVANHEEISVGHGSESTRVLVGLPDLTRHRETISLKIDIAYIIMFTHSLSEIEDDFSLTQLDGVATPQDGFHLRRAVDNDMVGASHIGDIEAISIVGNLGMMP